MASRFSDFVCFPPPVQEQPKDPKRPKAHQHENQAHLRSRRSLVSPFSDTGSAIFQEDDDIAFENVFVPTESQSAHVCGCDDQRNNDGVKRSRL